MDVPLAIMRPEKDQLPGACKNWLPVGRWIDVSNQQRGVTWATLDAPLVEIGEISATMLGSQKDPTVWRKHIEPTQKFYSWAMNNHWGTNYRAYQEGIVEFRYALRPHQGHDAAACSRFAIGLSQPLVAAPSGDDHAAEPLLRVEPAQVLVLALKPSDDGKAHIVRLFNASGETQSARIHWAKSKAATIRLSDVNERALQPVEEGAVTIAGYDLVTLRIEQE
jgi:alpha-mannosidase